MILYLQLSKVVYLGSRVGGSYAGGNCKETALMAAAEGNKNAAIEALIHHNANVDQRDHFGQTALHRAAASGSIKGVLALLQHDASAIIKNRDDFTSLMIAAKEGRT